jgi:uncharacterized membrane protein YcaP (DUF421 family)
MQPTLDTIEVMSDLVFGSGPETITWHQASIRAVLIFFYGVLIFRFAYSRMLSQSTDFDIVVAILIGSALSRTLTGNAKLWPTLAATTVLVLLHALLARLAWHWKKVGWLTKGVEVRLIEGGQIDWRAMRKAAITLHDLLEAARAKGTEDLSRIDVAVLERSGRINVILKQPQERQD